MSRYNEIRTMAREQHHHMACTTPSRLSHYTALCYGAEWADRTIIEKICVWLEKEVAEYTGVAPYVLKEAYIKAMEE